ncbi:MAG: hypothetical protein INR66_00365 [Gordonia polyisoprenivorans]|nr:hypothetical protein [Gordonia polyisoprenivorans]
MSERDRWQELLIPGTNVLRNLHGRDSQHPYGTEDAQLLAFYEQQWAARRFAELMRTPLPGELTPRTAESGSSVRALLALTRSRRSERPHPSVQSRFHPEHLPATAMVEPFRGPHPEV